jgi:hypothetical protein
MKAAVELLSTYLEIIEAHSDLFFLMKWEVRLNDISFVKSKTAEPQSFSVVIDKQACQVLVATCKHLELHKARNIFFTSHILI